MPSGTLRIGLLFAAVFVYLLMVVNYQNFGDPFVVILALPATFCGILTMLFITGTTLSVPSLMGAIMAVGVASANSILLVTFAREQQLAGRSGLRGCHRRGTYPHPPCADDGGGHGRWHDPDGDRRRRRGAERGAGARRHRRAAVRHSDDPAGRAVPVRQCCGRATTARPRTAYSRKQSMTDIETSYRQDGPTVERATGTPPKTRPYRRRQWGRVAACARRIRRARRGLAFGASRYYAQHREVMATAEQRRDFVPTVRVAMVRPSNGITLVTLPATTLAFAAANLYARASGYIDKRNVDIGDRVKDGQLLVQISAPELDHQISQNEATLVQLKQTLTQAQANLELAQVTWDRDRPLVGQGWRDPAAGARSTFRPSERARPRSASRKPTSRHRKPSYGYCINRRCIRASSLRSTA